jgi:hypothetical protein
MKGVRVAIAAAAIVIVLGLAAWVYMDYVQLQNGMAGEQKVFVFTDSGRLLAAFDVTTGPATPRSDLTLERVAYRVGDYRQLQGNAFKLIIMGRSSFPDVQAINISGVFMTKDEVFAMLDNGSVKAAFVARYSQAHNIAIAALTTDKLGTDDTMAGVLFAAMVAEQAKAGNIIMMTRDGRVTLYPETIVLRLITMLPANVLPYVIGGTNGP